MFVWDNSDGEIDISGAGLDERVVKDATGLLQSRYAVAPATYDHAQIADASRGLDPFSSVPTLKDLIAARSDRATVDAYIVIVPDSDHGQRPGGKDALGGAGLLRIPGANGERLVDYAYFLVAVVDARTCEPIVQMDLGFGRTTTNDLVPATRDASYNAVAEKYPDITEQQKQAFRVRLGVLLDDALKPTLIMLGLVPGTVPSFNPPSWRDLLRRH